MKKTPVTPMALAVLFLIPFTVVAQSPDAEDRCTPMWVQNHEADGPYGCFEQTRLLVRNTSHAGILKAIRDRVSLGRSDPLSYIEIAELMKAAGNPSAEYYYRKAIEGDAEEPAYKVFFGDYLRNYRGPLKPLFPRAEGHYFEALRKLARINDSNRRKQWDDETRARLERGLIALYQEEGIPVRAHNRMDDWIKYPERPLLFISSINKWARDMGDFDNVDDVRAFTSEALLAAQRRAEFGLPSLATDDFKRLVRVKTQYEILERLRFRYKALPALEVAYRRREIEHGAITNFAVPDQTNDVRINSEYGVAIEEPFSLPGGFDFFLRGRYGRIDRTGLIEFVPGAHEIIDQYEAQFAASRFIGPDKAIFQAVYVYQDITPRLENQVMIKRDRQIASGKLTYDLLRKFRSAQSPDPASRRPAHRQDPNQRLFELRGWNFFGGVAYDNERFGPVILRKNDYFAGTEVKGIKSGLLDVGYQATIFTSEVTGNTFTGSAPLTAMTNGPLDSSIELSDLVRRQNTQLRHNATVLIRLKDEEREPSVPEGVGKVHPAFVHLVFPFKYDVALDRHGEFENVRFGFQVDLKLYSAPFRGTSFLISGGYSRQDFFNLSKSVNLASARFSVGF